MATEPWARTGASTSFITVHFMLATHPCGGGGTIIIPSLQVETEAQNGWSTSPMAPDWYVWQGQGCNHGGPPPVSIHGKLRWALQVGRPEESQGPGVRVTSGGGWPWLWKGSTGDPCEVVDRYVYWLWLWSHECTHVTKLHGTKCTYTCTHTHTQMSACKTGEI